MMAALLISAARSVAWGDYDSDGDMDLAVGRYNLPNLLYQNNGGTLSLVWTAPTVRNTTSVAWGDWNNDGDLDLAVGNFNKKDQVYDNIGSTVSRVDLVWVWEAAANYKTTSLRWIDYDHDGDLDLSLSQETVNDPNGIYENSTVAAVHQVADYTDRLLLPKVPSYVSIKQPGSPGQIFARSNKSISATLTVPISITAVDPDTSRQFNSDLPGNQLKITRFQYSLDGGSRWYNATISPTLNLLNTTRRGITYTTQWLAGQDMTVNNPNQAVSDDVRFKITVSQQNTPLLANQVAGPTQRVIGSATSPPFRVRNITCVWPEGAYIANIQPASSITVGTSIRLWGAVHEWDQHAEGITYDWNFGDSTAQGVFVDHIFTTTGTHTITMTVSQPACPNTRLSFAQTSVVVAGASTPKPPTFAVYLPVVIKSGDASSAPAGLLVTGQSIALGSADLPRVTGLRGEVGATGTNLHWDAVLPPNDEGVYRVSRSPVDNINYRRLADLPASQITFVDEPAVCGYAYFVTTSNHQGESSPSTNSFYHLPCR